ncbi:MAG: hypothetical protein HFF07_03310 [Oscillospiraceae bacterium]|nr:hypothetical protein [Oscillospiraceae bacterium]
MRRGSGARRGGLGWLALPVGIVLALVLFAGALDSLTVGRSAEDLRQLEEALRRGCVSCYAVEGRYPPDLEYLKEHYGLQVDEERYTVAYDIFAPNLMPDITVLERKP